MTTSGLVVTSVVRFRRKTADADFPPEAGGTHLRSHVFETMLRIGSRWA